MLKEQGAQVIVECQKELAGLLASCPGIDRLVAQGSPVPAFDVQAPLASLPGILHTSLATIPANVPYLFADPGRIERWQHRLSGISGFKIGIAWQGNPAHPLDWVRSFPLACFEPLAEIPGVCLISLQKGSGSDQLAAEADRFAVTNLGPDLDESGAFVDTAAVMKNLDLVITSDTAIAHLAGALGVPVWVALRLVPDWRWLFDRQDSPWYPTMRLFRQTVRGNWPPVFESMADAVRGMLAETKLQAEAERGRKPNKSKRAR